MEAPKKNLADYVAILANGDNSEQQEKDCILCKMAREDHNPCEDCPAQSGEEFELWPENTTPALLFVLVMTQFRRSDSVVYGLDYNAVELVAKWNDIEIDAAMHESLRVCEVEYLRIVNSHGD